MEPKYIEDDNSNIIMSLKLIFIFLAIWMLSLMVLNPYKKEPHVCKDPTCPDYFTPIGNP